MKKSICFFSTLLALLSLQAKDYTLVVKGGRPQSKGNTEVTGGG